MGWVVGKVGRWSRGYIFYKDTGMQQCCFFTKWQKRIQLTSQAKTIVGSSFNFGTTHVLVNATYWLHRPCNAPSWFDRVSEKPAVKADLAISMIVQECLNYKLDFNSCAIWIDFCKSSHKLHCNITQYHKLTWHSKSHNTSNILHLDVNW